MKLKRNIALVLVIVLTTAAALGTGYWVSSSSNNCHALKVEIKNDKVTPQTTNGKLCDTLTITNDDNITRIIAFGPHEHHVAYDGVTDRVLHKNESLSITFNQTGSFHFHDHEHDEVQGYFNVKK